MATGSVISPRNFLVAMLIGVLPLLAASALGVWVLTAHHPAGGGIDALALTALCLLTYGFACVVLIPALGALAFCVHRRRLRLSPALATAALVCLAALVLPLLYVNLAPRF